MLDEAKLRVPIAKKVFAPVIMARFGNSAALLVHGGIPIAQALEIISHMVGNSLYRDVVHDIAQDVRQGVIAEGRQVHRVHAPAQAPDRDQVLAHEGVGLVGDRLQDG